MLNGPLCSGRAAGLARARGTLRAGTAAAVALLVVAGPRTAAAQLFQLPQACTHGATGSEGAAPGQGDDPVVTVAAGPSGRPFNNFMSGRIMGGTYMIKMIAPPAGSYLVTTTYTPFLTSSLWVEIPYNHPVNIEFLPPPGIVVGLQRGIHDTMTVRVMDSTRKNVLPGAFVDFIPFFLGSSPLTIQADSSGLIVLNCVQQVSTGYNVTVYDSNHNYVYDGSFSTNQDTARILP